MSTYRIIRTVDILGDEEFLVYPKPEIGEIDELSLTEPYWPYWFDSNLAFDVADYLNPEIYQSAEVIIVQF